VGFHSGQMGSNPTLSDRTSWQPRGCRLFHVLIHNVIHRRRRLAGRGVCGVSGVARYQEKASGRQRGLCRPF
jgi:hypothetical protein